MMHDGDGVNMPVPKICKYDAIMELFTGIVLSLSLSQ
jgi:hypothetical protein